MSAESNSAPKSELKVAATVTYAGAAWLALLGVLGQTRQRNRPLLLTSLLGGVVLAVHATEIQQSDERSGHKHCAAAAAFVGSAFTLNAWRTRSAFPAGALAASGWALFAYHGYHLRELTAARRVHVKEQLADATAARVDRVRSARLDQLRAARERVNSADAKKRATNDKDNNNNDE